MCCTGPDDELRGPDDQLRGPDDYVRPDDQLRGSDVRCPDDLRLDVRCPDELRCPDDVRRFVRHVVRRDVRPAGELRVRRLVSTVFTFILLIILSY